MSIARQNVYDIYDGCSVAMYLYCATLRPPDDYDDYGVAMHSHALYRAAILHEVTNEQTKILDTV
jgi:hypothetical protein